MCDGRIGWLLLVGLLAGCSGHDLNVASALVAAPGYLAADSVSKANEVRAFHRLQDQVAQGEWAALKQAMLWRRSYHSEVPDDEYLAMRDSAATQLIARDRADLPRADVLPMVYAYQSTINQQMQAPSFRIDPNMAVRSWQLAQRLTEGELDMNPRHELKGEMAQYVFLGKVQTMTDVQAAAAFKRCYVDTLMPRDGDAGVRTTLCEDAYKKYASMHTYGKESIFSPGRKDERFEELSLIWSKQYNIDSEAARKVHNAEVDARWAACDKQHRLPNDVKDCVVRSISAEKSLP